MQGAWVQTLASQLFKDPPEAISLGPLLGMGTCLSLPSRHNRVCLCFPLYTGSKSWVKLSAHFKAKLIKSYLSTWLLTSSFLFFPNSCCGCCLIAKLCPILCNPMDCSLPGSSVHGIFQARILERVAISSSRGSSWHRDWNLHLLPWQENCLLLSHRGSPPPPIPSLKKKNLNLVNAYKHFRRRQWHPTPYSCLENPRDGGAWWAASVGSRRVGHDWSDLA